MFLSEMFTKETKNEILIQFNFKFHGCVVLMNLLTLKSV